MKALSLFRHLHEEVTARVNRHGAQYQLYGWFGLINAPIYYLIWRYAAPESYENSGLRLFSMLLCLGLILHRYWPKRWQGFLPLYWYMTLLLTLPFFFAFMLIMNGGSLLGIGVALIHLSTLPDHTMTLTFNYRGFFITYLIAIVIGTLFSRNREQLEALTRRTIRLEAECQEKSLFIANLSHDLRTPLSGLLSLAEIELRQLNPQGGYFMLNHANRSWTLESDQSNHIPTLLNQKETAEIIIDSQKKNLEY